MHRAARRRATARTRCRTSTWSSARTTSSHLPALLESRRAERRRVGRGARRRDEFTSDLPTEREHPWHAWVPITVGCDNFCCVLRRALRARARAFARASRTSSPSARALASEGVLEVTLLGQNVNSYGRDLLRRAALRRACCAPWPRPASSASGSPRATRRTSRRRRSRRWPRRPQVCQSLHLPVQSGSNRILAAMNRVYTREHYLGLVERLYAAMPGPRAVDRHHRRLPRRDRGGLRGDARRRRAAPATTRPSRSSTRRERARPRRHAERTGCLATVAQARFDRLVELVPALGAREEPRSSSAPCSACSSRAPASVTRRCSRGAPTATRSSTSPVPAGRRRPRLRRAVRRRAHRRRRRRGFSSVSSPTNPVR